MFGTETPAGRSGAALSSSAPTIHRVTIEHTFEAAHRLPHLDGKSASLHGHSWRVAVSVTAAGLSDDLTVVESGALKDAVRQWIDIYLDHGCMLGARDPLVESLSAAGSKVLRFGAGPIVTEAESMAADLRWPTVEAVVVLLRRASQHALGTFGVAPAARVGRVLVQEMPGYAADFGPDGAE